MQRSKLLIAGFLLLPAGLTKLQVLPFAAVLVLVACVTWWKGRMSLVITARSVAAVFLAVVSVAVWPAFVALKFRSWNAYSVVQQPWNYWESIPFWGTVQWALNFGSSPNRAAAFALLAVVSAIAAAVGLFRDRRFSYAFRALSIAGPLFLLAVGAGASTVRYVLSFPGIPSFLATWVRSTKTMVILLICLLVSQVAWILVFVAAGPTEMPP